MVVNVLDTYPTEEGGKLTSLNPDPALAAAAPEKPETCEQSVTPAGTVGAGVVSGGVPLGVGVPAPGVGVPFAADDEKLQAPRASASARNPSRMGGRAARDRRPRPSGADAEDDGDDDGRARGTNPWDTDGSLPAPRPPALGASAFGMGRGRRIAQRPS